MRYATISPSYCNGDNGRCEFNCAAGYEDCDGVPTNGCEEAITLCGFSDAYTGTPANLDTLIATGLPNYNDGCPAAVNDDNLDCLILFDTAATYNVDVTAVIPYCVRNEDDQIADFEEEAGFCHFDCNDGYANCDGIAENGCESLITGDRSCTELCVDCIYASGLDYNGGAPSAIGCVDVDGSFECNLDSCRTNLSLCSDRDGQWETGCEFARGDVDILNIFSPIGDGGTDCSIMAREVHKNPELFGRHLHIDVYTDIELTNGDSLPAGTIFCNNGLNTDNTYDGIISAGYCDFVCEEGYENNDAKSWNGCETRNGGTEWMPEWRRTPTGQPDAAGTLGEENFCLYWEYSDKPENTPGDRSNRGLGSELPFEGSLCD
jgi:hypothetical protein